MTQIIDKSKERQFVHLGLNWEQFKSIQSGFWGAPSIRLFYYQGTLEIVFSRGGESKLERYQALGVPEVWFWEDGAFALYHLRKSGYESITESELVPDLDFELLTRCVLTADLNDAVREFRRGLAGG